MTPPDSEAVYIGLFFVSYTSFQKCPPVLAMGETGKT